VAPRGIAGALYHVIQGVALWLVYRGAARALAPAA
jgi:hypothetical protein